MIHDYVIAVTSETPDTGNVLQLVANRRREQEAKYPGATCAANVPTMTVTDRFAILASEVGEVNDEVQLLRWSALRFKGGGFDKGDAHYEERLLDELLDVAAVAVAWAELLEARRIARANASDHSFVHDPMTGDCGACGEPAALHRKLLPGEEWPT